MFKFKQGDKVQRTYPGNFNYQPIGQVTGVVPATDEKAEGINVIWDNLSVSTEFEKHLIKLEGNPENGTVFVPKIRDNQRNLKYIYYDGYLYNIVNSYKIHDHGQTTVYDYESRKNSVVVDPDYVLNNNK